MVVCYNRRRGCGNPQGILVISIYLASWWPRAIGLCPFRCQCNEDTLTVWCDSASLDVVPITLNPGLKELHLSNNRIKSIMAAFTVYQNLEYLDMAHNQLVKLGKNNFFEQSKLKILNLNRNMISSLKNNTFVGLESLKELRLDENILLDLQPNVFHPLSSLEVLDLSQNRISSISPAAFSGLRSLKKLLLRDNKLTQIPTDAFLKILSLQSLDVGLNSFQVIPENAFYPLRLLKSLSLDGCGVQSIQLGAFKGLESLRSLYLQDNEIDTVPIEALVEIPQLQELHLGQNRLKRLKPFAFQGLPSLRTLTVNGGKELEAIENGAFSENIQLERIIISHNRKLSHIDPETFQELGRLRFVSLRGNEFVTFREEMLSWEQLDAFDIRDNPVVCNCSLVWLWNLLRTKNFTGATGTVEAFGDVSRVMCASPPHMSGRALADATLDDLDCYEDTRRQILTGTVAAAGIIIALTVMLGLWHRHKIATKLEKKWKQDEQTTSPYQRPGSPEERFPPVSHMVRPSAKVSPITEL